MILLSLYLQFNLSNFQAQITATDSILTPGLSIYLAQPTVQL